MSLDPHRWRNGSESGPLGREYRAHVEAAIVTHLANRDSIVSRGIVEACARFELPVVTLVHAPSVHCAADIRAAAPARIAGCDLVPLVLDETVGETIWAAVREAGTIEEIERALTIRAGWLPPRLA